MRTRLKFLSNRGARMYTMQDGALARKQMSPNSIAALLLPEVVL